MTLLLTITLGCMAVTLFAKWFCVTLIEQKRNRVLEANEQHTQAKLRLKSAVQEVTINLAEIDRLKRKINTTERKIERLQTDYKKYHAKAVEQAEIDAEKLRLIQEMKKRKGQL